MQSFLNAIKKIFSDIKDALINSIKRRDKELGDRLERMFDGFMGTMAGEAVAELFKDPSEAIVAKLEEIRLWLVNRFGADRFSNFRFGPVDSEPKKIEMSDDTTPDTRAMEEAFATLQEKITDLFDETLADLIARTFYRKRMEESN